MRRHVSPRRAKRIKPAKLLQIVSKAVEQGEDHLTVNLGRATAHVRLRMRVTRFDSAHKRLLGERRPLFGEP